jgi:hypothetical protein
MGLIQIFLDRLEKKREIKERYIRKSKLGKISRVLHSFIVSGLPQLLQFLFRVKVHQGLPMGTCFAQFDQVQFSFFADFHCGSLSCVVHFSYDFVSCVHFFY